MYNIYLNHVDRKSRVACSKYVKLYVNYTCICNNSPRYFNHMHRAGMMYMSHYTTVLMSTDNYIGIALLSISSVAIIFLCYNHCPIQLQLN